MAVKQCIVCNEQQPLDAFHKAPRKSDGLDGRCKDCKSRIAQERWLQLKAEMLDAYGDSCTCCGEDEPIFLTIEHINADGKEHRARVGTGAGVYRDLKKRGWPEEGLTVLCFNCNMAKRWGRSCPHQN